MGIFGQRHEKDCSKDNLGHCGDCKWWQGQATGTNDHISLGLCMHADLVHFNLELSEASGCNRFEHAPALSGAEAEAIPALMPGFA